MTRRLGLTVDIFKDGVFGLKVFRVGYLDFGFGYLDLGFGFFGLKALGLRLKVLGSRDYILDSVVEGIWGLLFRV